MTTQSTKQPPSNTTLLERVHRQWVDTLDSIRDPIFVYDESGKVTRFNSAYAEMANRALTDIVGRRYWDMFPKHSLPLPGTKTTRKQSSTGNQHTLKLDNGKTYRYRLFPYQSQSDHQANDTVCILEDHSTAVELEKTKTQHQQQVVDILIDTINAINSALQKRDPYTANHDHKVARLAAAIGTQLQLPAEQLKGIYLGGIVHDIGKIYVPSEILNRPGRLNKAEFELIKSHPQVGYEILKDIDFPWPITDIVLSHHERLDGSGYPRGLDAKQISQEAKIIAVADVVEAMASHRPYRPALGLPVALDEIEKNKRRLYDETIVEACQAVFNKGLFEFE